MSTATIVILAGAAISVGANFWRAWGTHEGVDRVYRSATAFALSMFGVGLSAGAFIVHWL